MRIAIAAAGTGGHLYPALRIADALVERGVRTEDVLFLGGEGMERQIVGDAGYELLGFPLAKLRRSLTASNLKIPVVVRRSARQMAAALGEREVDLVLGMSGYVTVPAALAARRAGLPFVVHEQNAKPGLAARFGSRRARFTLLGLPGRSERLPRASVVGNPIRPALARFDRSAGRSAARARYRLGDHGPVLGVLGGSQGARVLNQSVASIAATGGVGAIVHLSGQAAHEEMARQAETASLPWRCLAFEDEMEHFYAAVDLVVARAGAMTISELAATGTPAITVPLERVGQRHNAALLVEAGAAVEVRQRDIGRLPEIVESAISDEARVRRMGDTARSVASPEAAETIAGRVIEAAGG